jgi:hypothetical protein
VAPTLGPGASAADTMLRWPSIESRLGGALVTWEVAGLAGDIAVDRLTEVGASLAHGPLAHVADWAADHQADLAAAS